MLIDMCLSTTVNINHFNSNLAPTFLNDRMLFFSFQKHSLKHITDRNAYIYLDSENQFRQKISPDSDILIIRRSELSVTDSLPFYHSWFIYLSEKISSISFLFIRLHWQLIFSNIQIIHSNGFSSAFPIITLSRFAHNCRFLSLKPTHTIWTAP